jgi:hypothetical protein
MQVFAHRRPGATSPAWLLLIRNPRKTGPGGRRARAACTFLGLAAWAGLSSCGYIGDPMPPSPHIPKPIADLTAVERGSKIEVHFTLPRYTTDGLLIRTFQTVEADIGPDAKPFHEGVWLGKVKALPIDVSADDQTSFIVRQFDVGPWQGQQVAIAIRTSIRNRRLSPVSNVVHLEAVPPLERPQITVVPTAGGYVVSWPQREGLKWKIYRRTLSFQKEPVLLATVDSSPYLDSTSQFDTLYEYSAVAIRETSALTAESEPSEAVSINRPDVYPPSVPASIAVLAGTNSIEVTWERSPESKLKGYYLWRAVGDGPFERLPDLLIAPAYSDRDVTPGKRYRYAVSAVDQKGNESGKSQTAEISLQ